MNNIIDKLVIKSWGLANGDNVVCYLGKTKLTIYGVNSKDGLIFYLMFDNGRDFISFHSEWKQGNVKHSQCWKHADKYFEIMINIKKEELLLLEPLLSEECNNSTPFLAEAFASRYGD